MLAGKAQQSRLSGGANVRVAGYSSSGRRMHVRVQASSEPTITVKFVEEGQQPVSIECVSGEEQLRAAMLDNKSGQQLLGNQHAPLPGNTAAAAVCLAV
jgi:hypothetical protein